MPNQLFGLPPHPLIVHLVVVFVPIAVVGTIALACSARIRDIFGWLVLAVDSVALAAVPLATESGESLAARVPHSPLIAHHAHLGGELLPLMIPVWVLAVAIFVVHRYRRRASEATRVSWTRSTTVGLAVLAVAASLAAGVQVVRIGDAGARAVWHGTSAHPLHGDHDD